MKIKTKKMPREIIETIASIALFLLVCGFVIFVLTRLVQAPPAHSTGHPNQNSRYTIYDHSSFGKYGADQIEFTVFNCVVFKSVQHEKVTICGDYTIEDK